RGAHSTERPHCRVVATEPPGAREARLQNAPRAKAKDSRMPSSRTPNDQNRSLRESRDSIRDIWGNRTGFEGNGAWPVRVDEALTAEPERWVQSACVLCSNGCALDIGVRHGRIVGVRGRESDRVNRGRLGPKGLHGWRAMESPDRLTKPLIRDGSRVREAEWDEAMDL